MKEKKCKICSGYFNTRNSTQVVCCMECALALSEMKKEKRARSDWHQRKKIMREKLETPSDRKNKLQVIFNEFIRLRDRGQPCISCNRSMEGKKVHAGHFYSVGRFPELRYVEENCHAQCEWCNIHLHGNGALYRLNLEKRIGSKMLEDLDKKAGISVHLMDHEIKELTEYYKYCVKEEKKKNN